jgi:hypothetical protein
MTTSEGAGKAGGQHAAEPSAAVSDPQVLEQEIERAREQLGQTVEQLVAKTDVKSRAQAKANELSGLVKTKLGQAQQKAASSASGAKQRRLPLAAAASASLVIVGYLVIRRWRSSH